jgi:hypothetical protein
MNQEKTMIASRWLLFAPLAGLAWACSEEPADDAGTNNATGGSGAATTGGASGTSGGAMGGTGGAVGGTGAGTTGGTGAATTGGVSGTGAATTGGVSGTAGVAPTGGVGGTDTGGAGGSGTSGTAGTGGSAGSATCTFTVQKSTSTRIPTVGIVTFTTDLAGMTEAHIDFGRDTSYGMTAPVNVAAADHRTLLLGMKAATAYHFRVVGTGPSGTCTGPDDTLMTGPLATGLPNIDYQPATAAGLYGGFLITGQYQGSSGGGAPAYILDADGDIVWWYITGQRDVTGVRMSYDGKSMWINAANVPSGSAVVHKVSMDGMMDENLSSSFTGQNHQLTVLPDETVAFYAYSSGQCDDIKERSPSGMVKTIVNSGTAHGASGACHVNAIEYSKDDDTLVFSDLEHDNITKVKRTGEVVWVLGGSTSNFTGTGSTWSRQHGIDVLGLDRILFFNNAGSGGANMGSVAVEILLNLGAKTVTRPWTYTAMPSIANQIMGDVQRLENGNTIVAYSTQGVLHEVNAQGQLLQELTWPLGGAFGYIQKRKTLYGPPPR